MRKILGTALLALFGCYAGVVLGQGLIMNEVSNGPAGTQEYLELVVIGPTGALNCGPVDIRGWIIDDNNGDFSCGSCAGTGIAAGHSRFASLAVWSAVPTGSIIVIYDPTIKNPSIPADDPNDTAPADGVYILPSNHVSLEASTTPCGGGSLPTGTGACGSCTGNPNYAGACYTAGLTNANWGLRNSGDAAQVRAPGGAYFHGISYGTPASLIVGGPDGLQVSVLDGAGRCFSFTNSVSNDFRSVANFAAAAVPAGETPGAGNSVNNAAWIASLKVICILPVNYENELSVRAQEGYNTLHWTTALETNADHWQVLRRSMAEETFLPIGKVEAAGNSQVTQSYTFTDVDPGQENVWYQLRLVDRNGSATYSQIVEVRNSSVVATSIEVWPNPSTGTLHVRGSIAGLQHLQIVDMMGRVRMEMPMENATNAFEFDLDLSTLAQGNYLLQLRSAHQLLLRRIALQGQQ